ncbi:MAG: hypothetical protein LBI57_05000 [Helicobacteraceae bacterium]|jgi:hypothetical protein|nr:hypothetical protein [Helicobacteraceae bacterium]
MRVSTFVIGAFALIMSGCAATVGLISLAKQDSERAQIKSEALENCLDADCRSRTIDAFDDCSSGSRSQNAKTNCYKDVFNNIRQRLIADCDKQKDNAACLQNIPAEKITE